MKETLSTKSAQSHFSSYVAKTNFGNSTKEKDKINNSSYDTYSHLYMID